MSALSHGWKPSKGSVAKIPVKVAKEFHAADAGHKYGKGHHAKRALHIAREHSKKAKKKAEGGAAGDDYNTQLSGPDEAKFQIWKAQKFPNDTGVDYDLRGAYQADMQPDPRNNHMGDLFKKPNHPTFSDQSQYATGNQRDRAGFWIGDEGPDQTFVPPVATKADGGEVDDDKAAAITIHPVDPNEGLTQDLTKKSPIEGMDVPGPSLSAHQDTPREKMTNWLAGPDTKSYEPRSVLANKAMNVLDFTPPMMAEQAGEDLAKGEVQNAALFAMPGVKKAKGSGEFAFSLLHAAENPLSEYSASNPVAKKLKEQYGKDLAAASIEYGYTPEQIDNIKTYMTPGAQANFDKHYSKLAPQVQPAPWNAPDVQATKPDLKLVPPSAPQPNLGSNFGGPINMDNMSKVSGALGTNPGGVYQGASGAKYYIKQGQTPDHVKNESIAAALYQAAGVPTLKYQPVQGNNHIATEWVNKEKDNAYKFSPEEKAAAQKDFAVHAWLANHDVVGTGGDNLGMVGGKPTALDLGGALEYRAQGSPKGKIFGNEVGELDSMRGLTPGIHAPDAAHMFGDMSLGEVSDSAMKVVSIPDQKIKDIVAAHGGDPKLADKLIARKNDLAERTGLQLFDPNFIEKQHGDDYSKILDNLEKELGNHKQKPIQDTDIEDYYAEQEKHAAGPEWNPERDTSIHPTPDIGEIAPHHAYSSGKINSLEYREKMREYLRQSDWQQFKPRDISEEKLPRIDFGKNDPEKLEQLGFNTRVPIFKGGMWNTDNFVPGGYPKELIDPGKIKHAEPAFFAATNPGIAQEYHGGPNIGGAYIARAPKFFEFDWDRFFGSHHYSDGDMDKVIQEAKKMGADVVALHNIHDIGSHKHGLHTQLAFLNTHVLRAPTANFDPTKLHLRHPLAGLAGGGIFTYGALSGEPDEKKDGGKVAKKDKDPGHRNSEPEDHEFIHFKDGGMLTSDIPGRTDKIPTKVRPGSYVLPADVPSALGQGNSQAGGAILQHMFSRGAYGLEPMKTKAQKFHFDSFPSIGHKAEGGSADGREDHVPIIAAGGEYIIPPEVVKEIGHGDMSKGHRVLDLFTLHTRKQHIKTLKGLKPPKE